MTRAAELAKLIAGGAVFNEASADVDFRVEGNGLTHALFVDGETDNVMIGTSVAGRATEGADRLTIADTSHSGMTIRSGTGSYGSINFSDSEGGAGEYAGQIWYGHGGLGDKLVFGTLGFNRVTVTENLTIEDGNLKLADGHGIDFSATGDNAGMEAELLDNYEEGTFTPSFVGASSGVSYSTQTGRYTLIGDLCTVFIRMSYTLSGFSGSNLRIGIPFTGHSGLGQEVQGGVLMRTSGLNETDNTANNDAYTFGIYNGSDIFIYQKDGTVRNVTGSFQDGTIAGSFTYKIA